MPHFKSYHKGEFIDKRKCVFFQFFFFSDIILRTSVIRALNVLQHQNNGALRAFAVCVFNLKNLYLQRF